MVESLKKTRQNVLVAKARDLKRQLSSVEKRLEKNKKQEDKKAEPRTEEEKRAALDRELEDYKYGPAGPSKSSSSRANGRSGLDDVFKRLKRGDASAEATASAALDDDLDNYFSSVGKVSFNSAPKGMMSKVGKVNFNSGYEEPRTVATGGTGDTRMAMLRRSIVDSLDDQSFKLTK